MTTDDLQQTEGRIQADCFQWFNNEFPALRGLMYHVPNGEKRDRVTAMKLKAMGVVAGIPDLEFHFWKRTFFLECKTPTGSVSKDQKKIHSILEEHGFRVFVFRSLEEFQTIVWAIIEDKSPLYTRGMTKADFDYRNSIFQYLYSMNEGEVRLLSDLVAEENRDRFKGLVFEFMNDGFDRLEGFEILFTPDYKGFYKKAIDDPDTLHYNPTIINHNGQTQIDVPNAD